MYFILFFCRRYRRRRIHVAVTIRGILILLKPDEELHMSIALTPGQAQNLGIKYLDASGHEILPPPAADAPPTWANSNDAAATLAVAGDSLSAKATAVAPGTDNVSVTVTVGGNTFSAVLEVDVKAPAVASIEIVPIPG